MYKTTLTILIIAFKMLCFGQATQTKYYNSEGLAKEVSQAKARFSATVIQNSDGTVTTNIKDLKKNEIVRSETFKGDEPYGIWTYSSNKGISTLDYNFPLIYSEKKCTDSIPIKTTDFFQDNDSLGYKAPKIMTGELSIYQFIAKNVIYPTRAKEEGLQGTVYIMLTLTKSGSIDNILVMRGTNILLDKEAVRVMRQLKLTSPPMIRGQAHTINCLALPIKYRLM